MPDLSAALMGNPQDAMAKMISEMAGDNPQLAMIMQLMQAQQSAAQDDEEDPVEVRHELEVRLAETEARLSEVRGEAHRLLSAHRIAVERLADLAAALGACGSCWGEDDDCPSCRGRGHVGTMRPDLETRVRLLGPQRQSISFVEHPAAH
jgi:hypothetical protein